MQKVDFMPENIGGNASHCELVNAAASGYEQDPNSRKDNNTSQKAQQKRNF